MSRRKERNFVVAILSSMDQIYKLHPHRTMSWPWRAVMTHGATAVLWSASETGFTMSCDHSPLWSGETARQFFNDLAEATLGRHRIKGYWRDGPLFYVPDKMATRETISN